MKKRRALSDRYLLASQEMQEKVTSLEGAPAPRHDLCHIVNVVSTNCILPIHRDKRYQLSLEALTQVLPSSQYAPCNFAANILRITDDTHHSAALIFRSGKINVVCSLSPQHGLYMSQLVRLLIEQIPFPMKDPKTGRIFTSTLEGRTQFNGWQANNIVGHSSLGMRVDLAQLHKAAPDVTKYKPDSFPGLKWRLWTTASYTCECERIQGKCQCTCRCLLFSSGKIVIVGARKVNHINRIFYRVKDLIPQFEDTEEELPRSQRFSKRLAKALGSGGWALPFPVKENDTEEDEEDLLAPRQAGDPHPSPTEEQELEDEVLAMELENMSITYLQRTKRDEGVTRLMRACDDGNVDLVEKLFLMRMQGDVLQKDNDGLTALDRIKDQDGYAHRKIRSILTSYIEEQQQEKKDNA